MECQRKSIRCLGINQLSLALSIIPRTDGLTCSLINECFPEESPALVRQPGQPCRILSLAQSLCHLRKNIQIEYEITFPYERLIIFFIRRTEPIAQIAPLMMLYDKSCFLIHILIQHKLDIAFHRCVMFSQHSLVAILLVELPRQGYTGTCP